MYRIGGFAAVGFLVGYTLADDRISALSKLKYSSACQDTMDERILKAFEEKYITR